MAECWPRPQSRSIKTRWYNPPRRKLFFGVREKVKRVGWHPKVTFLQQKKKDPHRGSFFSAVILK
jgi:hypothetical protein